MGSVRISPTPPPLPYPSPEAQTYWFLFLRMATLIYFSVEGCQGREVDRTNLRINFSHHHVRHTIIILEEGNSPHPIAPSVTCLSLGR